MSKSFESDFNRNKQEIRVADEAKCNIYGREKFLPEVAKEYTESLVKDFKSYYYSLGYKEKSSVKISSGIDTSVVFIGSGISVLKPYLLNNIIPSPGIFISQDCIRARNGIKLLEDNYSPNWGSFFTNISLVTTPNRMKESFNETFYFFEKVLNISPENILIRINSSDVDLLDVCRQHFGEERLEIDSRNIEYYRHKIGIDEVHGRNFNIALRNIKSSGFSDIGNFIIFEKNNKPIFIEIAFGTTTILKQLYGLDHVQDCIPVIGLNVENETIKRKFEDAIITSVVLFQEGLRPFGQNNKNRILRQYTRSLSYFRAKSKMSIEDLHKVVSNFEKREFSESTNRIADIILEYIRAFENELFAKKDLSNNENKIKEALTYN